MTKKEALKIWLPVISMGVDTMVECKAALNMAIAALKAEPCENAISRKHLLSEIDDLMKSPWFNRYKDDGGALHFGYIERKEAVEVVRDLCVKTEPPVTPKQKWIPVDYNRYPETYPKAFQEVWITDAYGEVYHM